MLIIAKTGLLSCLVHAAVENLKSFIILLLCFLQESAICKVRWRLIFAYVYDVCPF